jgi:sarcosine oxidase subunit alpha
MTRLPAPFGSRIDRSRPIRFSFEGKPFQGFHGDCIASALAASGQWMLSRSFKYHRPRGVFSMAGAEANTLVQLPSEPNAQADLTPIREGLAVTAQNVSGSLERDRDSAMDRLGGFLPVGFYYRTFIGPTRRSWLRLWEPLIRRKAGLGTVDPAAPHRQFSNANLHCDVLVVGAGPAGLSAAIEAAEAGADVVLCDHNPELGGSLTYRRADATTLPGLESKAAAIPNLRILTGTTCNGLYEDNWLPLIRGNELLRTRAREVVLTVGRIGQPAIFRNNDLPGILLGSAVQRLIRHYAVAPGRQAVVLGGSRHGYEVAMDLAEAGVAVAAVADPSSAGHGGDLAAQLCAKGVQVILGATCEEAEGTPGNKHVKRVRVAGRWIECDLLAVSGATMPAWQLPCQAGATFSAEDSMSPPVLRLTPGGPVQLAGSGRRNSRSGGRGPRWPPCRASGAGEAWLQCSCDEPAPAMSPENPPDQGPAGAHPKGRDFVDFDEDLQVKDLHDAIAEGYREIEL